MYKSQNADRLAARIRLSRSAAAGAVDAVLETIGEALAGLDARAAPELDNMLYVRKRPQDEDVLGPLNRGAALDCSPSASDAALGLCTVPALEPHGLALAVRLDEDVGDGMDEVGVRGHVVLRYESVAPARPGGSPRAPPKRSPPTRLDSRAPHVERTQHVAGRRALRCSEWEIESDESGTNAAARRASSNRRGAAGRSVAGERRSSRKRARRLRYDLRCGESPSGIIREPTATSTWRGIDERSGRACICAGCGLGSQYLRRQPVGGPLRGGESLEKPMRTVTSMRWTGDDAGLSLGTSRMSHARSSSSRPLMVWRPGNRKVGVVAEGMGSRKRSSTAESGSGNAAGERTASDLGRRACGGWGGGSSGLWRERAIHSRRCGIESRRMSENWCPMRLVAYHRNGVSHRRASRGKRPRREAERRRCRLTGLAAGRGMACRSLKHS